MTKDVSLTGRSATTEGTGLPPGPGKSTQPEREFSSVMEQASNRKAAHARTTRSAGRSRGEETPAAPARERTVRSARDSKPDAGPREAVRTGEETRASDEITDPQAPLKEAGVSSKQKVTKPGESAEAVEEEAVEGSASELSESETEESQAPANIVLFPGAPAQSTVIIPFPLAQAQAIAAGATGSGTSAVATGDLGAAAGTGSVIVPLPQASPGVTSRGAEEAGKKGLDVGKLGLKPVAAEGATDVAATGAASATEASAAASSELIESRVIAVAFHPGTAGASAESRVERPQPQLPGDQAEREESAPPAFVPESSAKIVLLRTDAAKSATGAGLTPPEPDGDTRPKTTGTSAAKQGVRMESMMTSEREVAAAEQGGTVLERLPDLASKPVERDLTSNDFAAQSTNAAEWQTARLAGGAEGPESSPEAERVDASGAVERISSLMGRETALLKKHGSDSLAVVLRPDAETELFVHLSQRDGQIEATVRCERGDVHQLGALWSQLQESLAQQKVRLAPLQDAPGGNSNFNQSQTSGGSTMSGGQNGTREDARPEKQSMDEWPAPAVPVINAPHVRGTGGSRRRRITTSRPGWETWA